MFYEPGAHKNHGLRHDPFKAIIAPRPIGWISTMGADGKVNLAPYSYFNGFSTQPPMVGFSSEGAKDSLRNVEETREFVCNLVTYDLRDAMNATSAPLPRGTNEMEAAGLEAVPSRLVKPPRVAASPCALECRWTQTLRLTDVDGTLLDRYLVIGRVVGIHIDERFLRDGLLDTAAMKPLARCGYHDYAMVDEVFALVRPT